VLKDVPELKDFLFFIPPLIGGLLGFRYAQGRTAREMVVSYAISVAAGIYVGAGLGEHFGMGYWTTGGVMFTTAALGYEALAYVIATLRGGDPAGALQKWLDAILGRRG
jgi:hypothetical protein